MKKHMLIMLLGAALALTACGSTAKNTDASEKASEAATEEASEAVTEAASETESEAVTEEASESTEEEEKKAESTGNKETAKTSSEIMVIDPDKGEVTYGDGTVKYTIEDPDEGGTVTLSYKDQSVQVIDYATNLCTSYLIPGSNGDFRVLAVTGDANDWEFTRLISYTAADGFTLGKDVDGGVAEGTTVTDKKVTLESRVDVFGTYSYTCDYKIDGIKLVQDGSYLNFNNAADKSFWKDMEMSRDDADAADLKLLYEEDGRRILTMKADMEATAENGSAVTVKAGDEIYPEGCDPDKNTFYFTYNGQKCHVVYEQKADEYFRTVNGVDEEDLFEILPYAG